MGFVPHMNDTPNLALPYILAAQAQKHVTHNEAIRALDCLVQLSVASRTRSEPPASPDDGSRYIVASGAGGDWAGQDGKVAAYQDGAWAFYAPKEGWRAWAASESALLVYEAGTWSALPSGGEGDAGDPPTAFDSLTHLGVNATADTTNRLSLKSPASLFDNEGAGHQQKINKKTSGDTASVLYQTNYSGRAEMGLTGDDDYHFKVSPDGSAWYEAIKIDRATGRVDFPNTGSFPAFRNRVINPCGAIAQAGFAATSDGSYTGFDQWYALTQTGSITPSQLSDVADGLPTMMRFTQGQSTAQRFGVAQPFESSFVKDLRSKTVVLAAKVRLSVATTLRYAIIEWTGTADSITRDVVADWTKTTFTAGQFFAASNLAIAATGSIALAANALTDIRLTATLSSALKNAIVFFWTDSTQAQNVTLDIGNVVFGQGASAPAVFERPDPIADLNACLRYFWQLPLGIAAAPFASAFCYAPTNALGVFCPQVRMRTVPSAVISAASDFGCYVSNGGDVTATAFVMSGFSTGTAFRLDMTVSSGLSAGNATLYFPKNSSAAIAFNTRL